MKLLNNLLLVKPLPKQPELKLLDGTIVTMDDMTAEERKAVASITTIEQLKDPQGTATYTAEVIALPETLDNKRIHHGIYGNPETNQNTHLYRTYHDIRFDKPQLQVGDIIWFHYNTGENAKNLGRVINSSDYQTRNPQLATDHEYWLIEYTHFRSIYAYLRDGVLTPLEYNIIVQPIIRERVSELLYTPEDGTKEKLKGIVVHPGKCGPIIHLEAGDTITHSKHSDVKLRVDGQDLYVMDGLIDVQGVIKSEVAA